jgi:hypothetical protein
MSDITQRDIEELKRLAEDGRKLTLPGWQYFVLWGLAMAAASFATYAVLRGWATLPIHYIWIAAIGGAWVGSLILGFALRHDPRGCALVNRVAGAIWIGSGLAISVIFVGLVLTGAAAGTIMVPVAHAVSGAAFGILGALARIRWLYVVALALWASSIASFYIIRTPELALLSAAMALLLGAVGLALARHARGA